MSTLFDSVNYDRHVRPVTDHRKPVVVDVRLSMIEIIGLDETNGRLTLKLHLNLVYELSRVFVSSYSLFFFASSPFMFAK